MTERFAHKKSNYNLRSRALQVGSIKTIMYGSEIIYHYKLKAFCLLYYSKRKFANGFQRIVYVVYVKCTYKILDFRKLSIPTFLLCNMLDAIHIKKSVEAVKNSKPHTPYQ